jgi:hypothetical protein
MIAVVDGEIRSRVEIGAAAAAGLLRRLVDMHEAAGIGEPHGSREAGNTGTNDMSVFLHQMIA